MVSWRNRACFCLAFSLQLALQALGMGAATSTMTNDAMSSTGQVSVSMAQDRANFVRQALSRRVDYVRSGKRTKDFARWVREHGGAQVISMHGAGSTQVYIPKRKSLALTEVSNYYRKDPFPFDRTSLELVVLLDEHPPNCYRGESLHKRDIQSANFFQLCARAAALGIHFAPVMSTVGLAVVSKRFRQRVWYSWLVSCIGSGGAAWIKWGQWSSTRNDMFPDALCEKLESLHNEAPSHPWSFSEKTMESSLGLAPGTLYNVFESFDHKPIASGSIAQVHKAVLNGNVLAVKIRHPRVDTLIDTDFRLMMAVARVFDWIPGLSWVHIRESVEQFSHTMAAQGDLHTEAHHLEVLNNNFRTWPRVRFPQPVYANSAVIIETFEPGRIVTSVIDMYERIADDLKEKVLVIENEGDQNEEFETLPNATQEAVGGLQAHELIPIEFARFLVTTGLGIYLKMLLVDNLMHADLHPGNIMIDFQRSNTPNLTQHPPDGFAMIRHSLSLSPARLRRMLGICLVDAGMVAQLTDDESSTFIGLLAGLGDGDGEDAAKFVLKFSLENQMSAEERASFAHDMVELFAERCKGYGTQVDVGHVLRGVLGLIRKHRVRIDANFATLVVNVLCVESLGRQVCPSYNVLDASRPLLRSYRRLCYRQDGTPKPQARKSRLFRLWLSLMYMKKHAADTAFFKREAQRNLQRTKERSLLLEY